MHQKACKSHSLTNILVFGTIPQMANEGDPGKKGSRRITSGDSGLIRPEVPRVAVTDKELAEVIALLSKSTQGLTRDEYLESTALRQDAVDRFLFRGGAQTIRRFFDILKQMRETSEVSLDLSMLDFNGKLLSDLYLPGANLEKIIITDSDFSGSNLHSANLTAAIGVNTIFRGADLRGANFTDGLFAGVDLSGARLMGCRFIRTDLTDAVVDPETNFAGSLFVGTFLRNTSLELGRTAGITTRGIIR